MAFMIALDSSRPLEGAIKLALFDAGGADCFSGTKAEARFSFIAPLVLLPFVFYLELLDPKWEPYLGLWWKIGILQTLIYAINITAVFCAADLMLRFQSARIYLPRFISASNWSSIVQALIFVPVSLLYRFELVDTMVLMPLMGIVAFGMLCYQWFVCRTTLRVSGAEAGALVFFNNILNLVLSWYIFSILQRA